MTNYFFFSGVLVRTPLYSFRNRKDLHALLQCDDFKKGIYIASASFYNELEKKGFHLDTLNEKQKHTIQKYANRALYRSTPFGCFSSVGLTSWKDTDGAPMLSEPYERIKLDFTVMEELWQKCAKENQQLPHRYKTNPTFFYNTIDYRYTQKKVDAKGNVTFSTVAIEKNNLLKKTVVFCRSEKDYNDIIDFLVHCASVSAEEAALFVNELISSDILMSTLAPTIVGTDYNDWLLQKSAALAFMKSIHDGLRVSNAHRALGVDHLKDLSKKLEAASVQATNNFYVISERKALGGGLPESYQEKIAEGLYALQLLSDRDDQEEIQNFKQTFISRYGSASVPLLEVLDSQFGIGYGNYDALNITYGFSSSNEKWERAIDQENTKGELISTLLCKWQLAADEYTSCIELTDEHLSLLNPQIAPPAFPTCLSVLFRIINNQVFIESAGGMSALSLLGRFGFNEEMQQLGCLIANKEQQLNKNVLFAEIDHLCNAHSANINRRPHFYDYEIPVLTNSTLVEEKQIQLNDLLVAVEEGQVVLRSKKLKRAVIPRLSTAFNFTKSAYPLFRFLCDVQRQGVQTSLYFSLASIVPGLPYYPRIIYKSCIIQLAEWHVMVRDINHIKWEQKDLAFKQLMQQLKIPRHFALANGDHFLLINTDHKEELDMFLREIEGKEKITLKEVPFLEEGFSVNSSKGPLVSQFVAFVHSDSAPYAHLKKIKKPVPNDKHCTRDWVYFKIYCHPFSSNQIINTVHGVLKKISSGKRSNHWFWIRYLDPQYHIRLRVRTHPHTQDEVVVSLQKALFKLQSAKLVHSFGQADYKRELDRYNPVLMEPIEAVFAASSSLIVNRIHTADAEYDDPTSVLQALGDCHLIFMALNGSVEGASSFYQRQFNNFFIEFHSSKRLKVEIEMLFKKVEWDIQLQPASGHALLQSSLQALSVKAEAMGIDLAEREKLMVDLIHMHLNRAFIYNQRYFEMITYYLLYRKMVSDQHRSALVSL